MCAGEHRCCLRVYQIVWVAVALSLQTKVHSWPLTSVIELVLTNEHWTISTTSFWKPKVNIDGRAKQRQRQRPQSIALSQLKSVFIWAVISIDLSFNSRPSGPQTADGLEGFCYGLKLLTNLHLPAAPGNPAFMFYFFFLRYIKVAEEKKSISSYHNSNDPHSLRCLLSFQQNTLSACVSLFITTFSHSTTTSSCPWLCLLVVILAMRHGGLECKLAQL